MAFKRVRRRLFKRKRTRRFRRRRVRTLANVDRVKLRSISALPGTAAGPSDYHIKNLPTTASGWTHIASMYQYYRVTGISIRYIPRANTVLSATTVGNPQNVGMYIVHDLTTSTWGETGDNLIKKALSFNGVRHRMSLRPFNVYFKMARITALTSQMTFPGGYFSTETPVQSQGIHIISEAANTTNPGRLIITYYVRAHTRRTTPVPI